MLFRDRRNTERINLRCAAELIGDGSAETRRSVTLNISSKGLYCVSEGAYTIGEKLRCEVQMPAGGFRTSGAPVLLECLVEVIRVELRPDGFGLGCRIAEYVLRPSRGRERAGVEGVPAGV